MRRIVSTLAPLLLLAGCVGQPASPQTTHSVPLATQTSPKSIGPDEEWVFVVNADASGAWPDAQEAPELAIAAAREVCELVETEDIQDVVRQVTEMLPSGAREDEAPMQFIALSVGTFCPDLLSKTRP